uniref:Dynamin GTPase n=1 Tax=Panagrolaimus sp. ES5 TaxID=591445 RepID=A0AC34GP64_9BILA
MESLIPVIGKLQDVFATVGNRENEVQLPQIVVVGSQSAGKSSVIEGIVGRDFLPRGSGIVTRRPLLIHLIHTPKDGEERMKDEIQFLDISDGDWATFEHLPNTTFTDFENVRQEIQTETNRLIGTNKGISREPINLKIYSANVVNLSLIDLPGITKVPVGDQPSDIEDLVRQMILSYISNPQSIILAVTPANQDFANSDALKLAKEVDEDGNRTLCVLTKLDLMDRGTDAMAVLMGHVIPVKLGIIGVVNRSQADIDSNQTIEDCLKDEMSFLYKKYPTLATKNGIQYLAKTLNKLLIHHIRESLPQLKHRISTMITQFQTILESLGEPIDDKRKTFLQCINRFSSAYISTIYGSGKVTASSTNNLSGGARICSIFFDEFDRNIESIDSMGELTCEEVLSVIKNGAGLKPAMFIPEKSFDILVKKQMKRFKAPMINCVDLVYEELIRIIQHCGDEIKQEMSRFPHLYNRIHKIVSTIISTRIIKTKEFVDNLLEIELAFINTTHPEFINYTDLGKAFNEDPNVTSTPVEKKQSSTKTFHFDVSKIPFMASPSSGSGKSSGDASDILIQSHTGKLTYREKRDFRIIEKLINQYFLIVRKSIKDKVPKAIMKFLINYINENLQSELTEGLYDPANVEELLVESGNMAQRRKETAEMLKALNKANDVLSEIRDTEIW